MTFGFVEYGRSEDILITLNNIALLGEGTDFRNKLTTMFRKITWSGGNAFFVGGL